jgi:CubicO group peptidase (beta-lactamase class C family)
MTQAKFQTPIAQVDGAIDRALAEQRLVGTVVLIARDGEIVYHRAAGLADREADRPMREDAIFRYSSLTKPLVCAAVMVLIERGQLGLDDVITRWLPAFRPRGPDGSEAVIRIRHLLTHTAGLSYNLFEPTDGPYHKAGVSDGLDESGLTMEEELRRLSSVPLWYTPGTSWGYSLAIDVLGAILEVIARTPLPAVIERLVTAPLRMSDTGFAVPDRARLVVPYVDSKPPRRMSDPDSVPFLPGTAGIRFSPSRIFDTRSFASGGGGMAGTAADFLTFLEAIRRGGSPILQSQSTRAMMTNQIGALRITTEQKPAWGFGFGGAILMEPDLADVPQAEGTWNWGGVYGHHWFVDPQRRLTLVALTNTALEGMVGEFVRELMCAAYAG